MSCLYTLEINPLSVVSFAIIFSHSEGYFHLAYSFLCCANTFKFNHVSFLKFCFYFLREGSHKRFCCDLCQNVLPMFFFKSCLVSGFTFRSLTHLEFIFVYGVR